MCNRDVTKCLYVTLTILVLKIETQCASIYSMKISSGWPCVSKQYRVTDDIKHRTVRTKIYMGGQKFRVPRLRKLYRFHSNDLDAVQLLLLLHRFDSTFSSILNSQNQIKSYLLTYYFDT